MQLVNINNHPNTTQFGSGITKTKKLEKVTNSLCFPDSFNYNSPKPRNFLGALKSILNDGKNDIVTFNQKFISRKYEKDFDYGIEAKVNNQTKKEYNFFNPFPFDNPHPDDSLINAVIDFAKTEKGFKPVTRQDIEKNTLCGTNIKQTSKKQINSEKIHQQISKELKEICEKFI